MLSKIQQTIEEIKSKVSNNVALINSNQQAIKVMVSQSDEFAGQYEEFVQQNKILLAQNNDLINVQLTLMNFLEKYKDTAILKEDKPMIDIYSITDRQEIFTLTIKELIPFNVRHPYYNDSEFISKLLVYYESKEEYEKCQELMGLQERL